MMTASAVVMLGCGARSGLELVTEQSDASHDAVLPRVPEAGRDATAAMPDASEDSPSLIDARPDAPTDSASDAALEAPSVDAGYCLDTWLWTTEGDGPAVVEALAATPEGGMVAVGEFGGSSDFGLGPTERRTATGYSDTFVVKLDCRGMPEWVRTWGGDDLFMSGWGDEATAVAVAPDGSIFVAGQYCTTVDFDPGSGADVRTSVACFDGYLNRLTSTGDHVWTRTFGGSGRDRVSGVALTDDGTIAISGQFENTVDFDPGSALVERTSVGSTDVFASKLTLDGELLWVDTWGGPSTEYGPVSVGSGPGGTVSVAGPFESSVDFDPGSGVDTRSSAGGDDAYVVKLQPDGSRAWADTFGGLSSEYPSSVVVDRSGALALSGFFYGSADFDPGAGVDVHDPGGQYAAFLTRFEQDGTERWTRTWGKASGANSGLASAANVSAAADGSVVVAGDFSGVVDFGAGSATDVRSAAGNYDAYVSAFSTNGGRAWTWSVGGTGLDGALAALSTPDGHVVAAGIFSDAVQFDLGPRKLSATAGKDHNGFVVRFDPSF